VEASDRELVDGLRSGDSQALGDLFDRHADRIYTYCFRRTASWATAEDATSTDGPGVLRPRGRRQGQDGRLDVVDGLPAGRPSEARVVGSRPRRRHDGGRLTQQYDLTGMDLCAQVNHGC
jgi:hypothetical protein